MKKTDVEIINTRKQYLKRSLDQPLKEKNNFVTEQ